MTQNKFKTKFYKLNKKRTTNLCCGGLCFNNWVSEKDTLFCGKCEQEKHIDNFLLSNTGFLCDECAKFK